MINVGGGFNPMSLPPVRRQWDNGGMVSSHGPGSGAPNTAPGMRMVNSSGGNTPGNLPFGMVNSSPRGGGNLPRNTGIAGGGNFGGFGGGISMNQQPSMVQGPSFMQQPMQQQPRNRMAGGMIDPSWRYKMAERAASTGTTPAEKVRLAGEGRADPMGWAARFQRQDNPQPQQQYGMGGGDPMQMMMQMMPFWQMYSQMLGGMGGQRSY